MKDAYYFPHDCNARHDPALVTVCHQFGLIGYSCFFITIEMLREQNEYQLPVKFKPALFAAWRMGMQPIAAEVCQAIYDAFITEELLKDDGNFIWSDSLNERMATWDENKEKQRESGRRGGLKSAEMRKKKKEENKPPASTLENEVKEPISVAQAKKEKKEKKENRSNTTYVAFEQATRDAWNAFCDKNLLLSKIEAVSGKRREHLKVRFGEARFAAFGAILTAAAKSDFLLGRKAGSSWKMSFDWLIKNDTNYIKVLEGQYSTNGAVAEENQIDPAFN